MSAIGTSDDIDDTFDSGFSPVQFLDYIPLVSVISGVARAVFGIFETLFGIIALPFQLGARAIGRKHPFICIEGVANIIRGVIAIKPIIGNVILYIYDHSKVFKRDIRKAAGIEV